MIKMKGKLQSSDIGIQVPAERHLRKKWKIICLNSVPAFMSPKPALSASALQNQCVNLRMSINIVFMCQDIQNNDGHR